MSFRNFAQAIKRRYNGLKKKQQRIKKVQDELLAKKVDLKKLFTFANQTESKFLQTCMSNNGDVSQKEFVGSL